MSVEDTRDERAHWIALHRAPGIGPKAFFDLLARYGSAEAVFAASSMELERHGLGSETLAFIKPRIGTLSLRPCGGCASISIS